MEVEEAGPIAPDKNLHARNTRLKGFPSQEAKTRLLERMPEATVGWTFPSAKHREVGPKRRSSHRCILETGRKGKHGREEAEELLHPLGLDWIRRSAE